MIEQAINKITSLQPDEPNHAWMVGEHLKDLCLTSSHDAELIFHDLDIPEMSLAHAARKLKAYADSHRVGNEACVPPKVAEDILRKFYHLTPRSEQPPMPAPVREAKPHTSEPPKAVALDLDDFL